MQRSTRRIPTPRLFAAVVLALALPAVASASATESFIVQCSPKCDAVAAAVSQIPGARVDQVYQNVNGLAVTLPVSAVPDIQGRSDVSGMSKDINVFLPPPTSPGRSARPRPSRCSTPRRSRASSTPAPRTTASTTS